jgi:hypothetical protein
LQPFPYGSEEFFRFQLIKGQIAKELVKGLLETSHQYQVYSFGYESTISQLRYHVMQHKGRGVDHTASNERMRSMPDLIVYDREDNRTSFVEVKFRNAKAPERVSLPTKELQTAKTHWGDSIWIVVIPVEHNFYAQKLSDIKIFDEFKTHRYDLTKEFRHIEEEFPKVTLESVKKYWSIRNQFLSSAADDSEE